MVMTKSQYLQNKYKTNHRIRCSEDESCVVKPKIKPVTVIRGKDYSSALNALNQHPLKSAHATKSHYLFLRHGRKLPFHETSQEHIEEAQENLRFLSRSEQIRRKQNAVLLHEYEQRGILNNVKNCITCDEYYNSHEFMKL